MFDMGFTEMMLIGIVALVVIGPERLPGVARTAGKYFSRLRSFVTNVRADVESELKADELREMFETQQQELQSLKEVVSDAGKGIGLSDIADEMSEVANSIDDTKPIPEPRPKAKAKSATKDLPAARVAAKSATKGKPTARAKSGVEPKAAPKLKRKASVKTKSRAKVRAKSEAGAANKSTTESNWTGALEPPTTATGASKAKTSKAVKAPKTRAKAAKPAKIKAK